MSKDGVLYIGDGFAEMGVVSDHTLIKSRLWHRGREPLSKTIATFFKEQLTDPMDQFVVCHKSLQSHLRRRFGTSFAFLVTAGFENWLEINSPGYPPHFTTSVARAPSFLEPDLIFGLSERITADGEIEKPLEIQELEFLTSKLKLHHCQDVAIGLLHSYVNPVHEQQAAKYFRQEGFRVHLSSEISQYPQEVARWWAASTNAYLTQRHLECVEEIHLAFKDSPHAQTPLYFLGGTDLLPARDPQAPLQSLFGPTTALDSWRQNKNSQTLLYLGLEDFWMVSHDWPVTHEQHAQHTQGADHSFHPIKNHDKTRSIWSSDLGPTAILHRPFCRLPVQNTQWIEKSFWGVPGLSSIEGGFEPGPMCLGKGLVPQLLDVFWLRGRLTHVEGFSDRLVEKMKSRIEEALMALARESKLKQTLTPHELSHHLEMEACRKLILPLLSVKSQDITLCGPMSSALKTPLSEVFKDVGIQPIWSTENYTMLEILARWTST